MPVQIVHGGYAYLARAYHEISTHPQKISSERLLELLLLCFAGLVAVKVAVVAYKKSGKRVYHFIPYQLDFKERSGKVVVTDCTHPSAPTFTHHKGGNNPVGLKPCDTSTGIVLNALHHGYLWSTEAVDYLRKPFVTSNHFDLDAFLSVWCFCNRKLALQHEGVLRHMARIGDFREAFLSPELVAAWGAADRISSIRDAYTALKLCCWVNTTERRLFSAPYEAKDCAQKFEWFLPRFADVLQDPESAWTEWQQEYTQVVSGFDALLGPDCSVERYPDVGLVVVTAPEPLHYYSLFSHTIGFDTVLAIYSSNRYEVESKYTQFVNVYSRPVWPRLDFGPLATVLNQIEQQQQQQQQQDSLTASQSSQQDSFAQPDPQKQQQQQVMWSANRFTDTGPLLRLEQPGVKLSKAQRYGHPTERPILSSSVGPQEMRALVVSYLDFGRQGLAPRVGGWGWEELHKINSNRPWQQWAACALEQHQQGELAEQAGTTRRASHSLASLSGTADPHAMPCGDFTPQLSEPSLIMKEAGVRSLAASLPALYQRAAWQLEYSSSRDGISLNTFFRRAERRSPTLLLVRDSHGFVFGAFASEPWRVSPRFYGTGETFVFQLEPRLRAFRWQPQQQQHQHQHQQQRQGSPDIAQGGNAAAEGTASAAATIAGSTNSYFLHSTHECLAVGGAGHWAIWLDGDLLNGTSGLCDTFGSPCLASAEEFKVLQLELWHLH